MADKAELAGEILLGVAERSAARNQLAELGISASPADVSWWLALSAKQRQKAALDYAILVSSER